MSTPANSIFNKVTIFPTNATLYSLDILKNVSEEKLPRVQMDRETTKVEQIKKASLSGRSTTLEWKISFRPKFGPQNLFWRFRLY